MKSANWRISCQYSSENGSTLWPASIASRAASENHQFVTPSRGFFIFTL